MSFKSKSYIRRIRSSISEVDSFEIPDSEKDENSTYNESVREEQYRTNIIDESDASDTNDDKDATNDQLVLSDSDNEVPHVDESHVTSIIEDDEESEEVNSESEDEVVAPIKKNKKYQKYLSSDESNEDSPVTNKVQKKKHVLQVSDDDVHNSPVRSPPKAKNYESSPDHLELPSSSEDNNDSPPVNNIKKKVQNKKFTPQARDASFYGSDIEHTPDPSPINKVKKKIQKKNYESDNGEDSSHTSDLEIISTMQSAKKNSVIDLTHYEEPDEVEPISKNQSTKERPISLRSETPESVSETEIDPDVFQWAKSEIGVGNIDPLAAQKKEYYIHKIAYKEDELKKAELILSTLNLELLPDKGEKLEQSIELLQNEIASLKLKSSKLSTPTFGIQNPNKKPLQEQNEIRVKAERSFKKDESYVPDDSINDNSYSEAEINDADSSYDSNVGSNKKSKGAKKPSENSRKKRSSSIKAEAPDIFNTSYEPPDLGKRALETFNKERSLTVQRLERLHGSIVSRPTENEEARDPPGLTIPLMSHQKHALAWLRWRETQKPRGGILADDMGLGKTLTMISLILATIDDDKENSDKESDSDDGWIDRVKRPKFKGGTLVVCPASLMKQWESEIKNRLKRGMLSTLVYHGSNRINDPRRLSKYNVVVTTYQLLVRESKIDAPTYRIDWKRIILDEGHCIRNYKSQMCEAVCKLNGRIRWALTGTPIQNKEIDLYGIIKFLRCSPFDDLRVWKRWVENRNTDGNERLVTIMKSLMLRRTKEELQSSGSMTSLPDKNIEIVEVELDEDEKVVYQKILIYSQTLFAQFLAQRAEKQHMNELYAGKFDEPIYARKKDLTSQFTKAQKVLLDHHASNAPVKSHQILVLLLRLRQMCCHPALIHSFLNDQESIENGIENDDESTNLLSKLSNMKLDDEDNNPEDMDMGVDQRVINNLLTLDNPVFREARKSSKMKALLQTIADILKRDRTNKLVVVSQWTSMLNIIGTNLKKVPGAEWEMFSGETAIKKRQPIVDRFNDPNDSLNILLLSLSAGGVGLNLIGGNNLLLFDIHWNPQLEAQAQDRIYRFGQKRSVYIYKFLCKDTIEERIKALQDRKLEVAQYVLTGTRSMSSKLTIDDLKSLFNFT